MPLTGPQHRATGVRSSNKGQGANVLVNPGNSSLGRGSSSTSRNTSLSRQSSMNRTTSSPRGSSSGGGFGSSSSRNVGLSSSSPNSSSSRLTSSSSSSNSNMNVQQHVEKENSGAREPRPSQQAMNQLSTQLDSVVNRLSNLEEEHKLTRLELTSAKKRIIDLEQAKEIEAEKNKLLLGEKQREQERQEENENLFVEQLLVLEKFVENECRRQDTQVELVNQLKAKMDRWELYLNERANAWNKFSEISNVKHSDKRNVNHPIHQSHLPTPSELSFMSPQQQSISSNRNKQNKIQEDLISNEKAHQKFDQEGEDKTLNISSASSHHDDVSDKQNTSQTAQYSDHESHCNKFEQQLYDIRDDSIRKESELENENDHLLGYQSINLPPQHSPNELLEDVMEEDDHERSMSRDLCSISPKKNDFSFCSSDGISTDKKISSTISSLASNNKVNNDNQMYKGEKKEKKTTSSQGQSFSQNQGNRNTSCLEQENLSQNNYNSRCLPNENELKNQNVPESKWKSKKKDEERHNMTKKKGHEDNQSKGDDEEEEVERGRRRCSQDGYRNPLRRSSSLGSEVGEFVESQTLTGPSPQTLKPSKEPSPKLLSPITKEVNLNDDDEAESRKRRVSPTTNENNLAITTSRRTSGEVTSTRGRSLSTNGTRMTSSSPSPSSRRYSPARLSYQVQTPPRNNLHSLNRSSSFSQSLTPTRQSFLSSPSSTSPSFGVMHGFENFHPPPATNQQSHLVTTPVSHRRKDYQTRQHHSESDALSLAQQGAVTVDMLLQLQLQLTATLAATASSPQQQMSSPSQLQLEREQQLEDGVEAEDDQRNSCFSGAPSSSSPSSSSSSSTSVSSSSTNEHTHGHDHKGCNDNHETEVMKSRSEPNTSSNKIGGAFLSRFKGGMPRSPRIPPPQLSFSS